MEENEERDYGSFQLRYDGLGRFLAGFLLVATAGAGGSYVHQKIDPPREDPFTGTEGRAIEGRLGRLEERLGGHVAWAADKRESLFHDYRDLESRVQILESKVEQLERRVNRLHDE